MPKKEDILHSVLIVSVSEQFAALVKRSLTQKNCMGMVLRKNAGMARRSILERYFDIVIIDVPLPDELGVEMALDIRDKCEVSVLLVVSKDMYDDVLNRVTDYGILVIAKPFPRGILDKAIRFLIATQNRIRRLEMKVQNAQEKIREIRTVDKAKILLVQMEKMTEDDAHRYIGKYAMDRGISRGSAARMILEDLE